MPVSQLLVAAGHPCSLNGRHTTLVYASIFTWASPLCWCVTPSTFSLTRTLVIGFGATLDKPGGYLKILHLVASVKNFSPNKINSQVLVGLSSGDEAPFNPLQVGTATPSHFTAETPESQKSKITCSQLNNY